MNLNEEVEILKGVPIFAKIEPAKLKLIAFTGERMNFGAGQELFLDWRDLQDSMDTEARLSRLARWVLLAREAGVDYALDIPGVRIEPGSGDRHFARCLEALALHEPGRG